MMVVYIRIIKTFWGLAIDKPNWVEVKAVKILLTFRARLVRCNGYYTVIRISITRNRISCNEIAITIHQFGNNT